jgi:hypothetical protein
LRLILCFDIILVGFLFEQGSVMINLGRVLGGTCVVAGAGSLAAVNWIENQTSKLKEEQKGSLLTRTKEVAGAAVKSGSMTGDHVKFVAGLPSKEFVAGTKLSEIEQDKLGASYLSGYLTEAVKGGSKGSSVVFRYTSNLAICLPKINNKPYEGFVYSGEMTSVFDSKAREQVLEEDYVRCGAEQLEKIDGLSSVIITGTKDCEKCDEFARSFLSDLIVESSERKGLSSKHSFSITPVFSVDGGTLERVGDLSNYPEKSKRDVKVLNYTYCPFYTLEKTRLSRGSYEKVGAVISGLENPKACDLLAMGAMRDVMAKSQGKS